MENIEISRELAEKLLALTKHEGYSEEKEELQELLKPVTVQDYLDSGRKDELQTGMWVEDDKGNMFILVYCGDNFMDVFKEISLPEEGKPMSAYTPRFDVQPMFTREDCRDFPYDPFPASG